MANKIKSLHTLIDIRQKELEKLQALLGAEEQKRMQALAQQERLSRDLYREQRAAEGQPDMLAFLAEYAKNNHLRRQAFRAMQERAEKQIDQIQGVIRDIFGELKKLEIARDSLQAREDAVLARREQQWLDELGIQAHRRGQGETS